MGACIWSLSKRETELLFWPLVICVALTFMCMSWSRKSLEKTELYVDMTARKELRVEQRTQAKKLKHDAFRKKVELRKEQIRAEKPSESTTEKFPEEVFYLSDAADETFERAKEIIDQAEETVLDWKINNLPFLPEN